MEDLRFGTVIRAIRIKRGWRQADLAAAAKVSRATISRVERGHLGDLSLATVRRLGAALDVRVDLTPRWRGGELDRLVNARHSLLHETLARWFKDELPDWVLRPEVSFAVYGERGVIDILAWHPERRALLVIELKTEIVDVNDLVGSVDRKRRLAAGVAESFGWDARSVSVWVVVAGSQLNRRRVAAHRTILRAAFPQDGRSVVAWLRKPSESLAALSIWPGAVGEPARTSARRVRRPRRPPPDAEDRRV